MSRRIAVLALATLLGGCASFNQLNNEVSSFGPWPAERQPASYAFERLPSQATQPEQQQLLEDAASGALQQAGFAPGADPQKVEYQVQLDARVTGNDPWAHNDPLFWRGGLRRGYGGYYHGGWGSTGFPGHGWGLGWGPFDRPRTFEREVVVLIRDRRTSQLLYETRASNNALSASIDSVLPAMFEAAMKDFPRVGPNPRRVTVPLSGQ